MIDQTDDLTLFTDGERRYGNILFMICHQVMRDGKPGRPKTRLRKGVRVRLKNKGSKNRVGKPREKDQSPIAEHPETSQEPDANEYEKKKQELDVLKEQAAAGEIDLRYFDESGFSLSSNSPYAWQDKARKQG